MQVSTGKREGEAAHAPASHSAGPSRRPKIPQAHIMSSALRTTVRGEVAGGRRGARASCPTPISSSLARRVAALGRARARTWCLAWHAARRRGPLPGRRGRGAETERRGELGHGRIFPSPTAAPRRRDPPRPGHGCTMSARPFPGRRWRPGGPDRRRPDRRRVDAGVELLPDAPPSRRPLLFSQTVAMATKAAKKVTAKKAAPRKAAPRKASSKNSFYGPDRPKFL